MFTKIEEGIKAPLASLNIPDWKGVWLAGGALRSMYCDERVRDYDVIFDTRARLDEFRKLCVARGWKHDGSGVQTSLWLNDEHFDCSHWFGTPTLQASLSNFDLTNSMIGCDMAGNVYIDPRCQYAMDTRSFKIINAHSGQTLKRIHKFMSRGWVPDYPSLDEMWADYIMKLQVRKNVPIYRRTSV